MRKTILASVLGLTLLMGACTSTQMNKEKASNINFYTVAEKNNKDILNISGEEVESKYFKMNLEFSDDMIRVGVTNISDEVILVDWDSVRYTGLDEEEQKTFDMKQKEGGLYSRQNASPLRPGQSYIAELVPVNNIHFVAGGSTGLGTIYIEKKMFTSEKEMQKRDYAKLMVPITVGGIKKGSIQKYEVYFGEGDMPVALGEQLASKEILAPVPVVAPKGEGIKEPVTSIQGEEALKIQSENELLEQEIKNKEAIIKQLEEKAKLQDELDKKQKEIDALMKSLN